ncbi:MAG: SAM-dependent methyltransferase YrrT [Bacillales bacterium]|jgi:putative AdoMet-dependent methyltransferase|nr:SAM-dependent methyltransferase YrrT [Bacillales bacterium]
MGREFDNLFDKWSETYDSVVLESNDEEYKEVFINYNGILETVASNVSGIILEFGIGTGNLTKELVQKNNKVIGIEPSKNMRLIAKQKLPSVEVYDGDFLKFQLPKTKIDGIVSTYAFHHLTDFEKNEAIKLYKDMLTPSGKIVFADTIFTDEDHRNEVINESIAKGYLNLVNDLKTEYYTTIPIMKSIFESNGFDVTFTQLNKFVWLIKAEFQQ